MIKTFRQRHLVLIHMCYNQIICGFKNDETLAFKSITRSTSCCAKNRWDGIPHCVAIGASLACRIRGIENHRFVTPWKIHRLHPKKEVWNMMFLFNWVMFRFHVNFPYILGSLLIFHTTLKLGTVLNIYIYRDIFLYIYIHICKYIYIHMYIYVYIYVNINIYIYMYALVSTFSVSPSSSQLFCQKIYFADSPNHLPDLTGEMKLSTQTMHSHNGIPDYFQYICSA